MEFKQIVMKRYATKNFDGRKIPEEKVNELLEMIRYAPSSFNIQPWKIIVIKDQAIKDKLLPFSWNQPQVANCSHLLVFCANKNILENINLIEKESIKKGAKPESIKEYIKIMQDFEKSLDEEQKLNWAQKQTYIALGNALNGAKSLGFDSCPMEGFQPEEYSKILQLPGHLVPTVACPIGYASDKPKPKFRFEMKEIRINL